MNEETQSCCGPQPTPSDIPSTETLSPWAIDVKADKELRKHLDRSLQYLKGQNPSRERSLAITKLQECIMWLGMDLKRLSEPNPYPESYNPDNVVIAPTADGLKL